MRNGSVLHNHLGLEDFKVNPSPHLVPAGFLDGDPDKVGKLINSFPVLGTIQNLPILLETYHPSQIIAASGKILKEKIQVLKQICEERGIQLKRFTIGLEKV